MLNSNNRDLPREDLEKPSTPLINVQNTSEIEETYYGKFRSIVKQRYFGIKLEEGPFMEFIDQNQDIKDKLTDFINLMIQVKNDYIGFLKKSYPDRIEKRKRKRKSKKKGSDLLDVPRDSDAFSSDFSGILSPSSRDEIDTVNESQALKSKIETIKKDFSFQSIENVAKNIHLFDDLFGKLKADHTKTQQLNQLKQFEFGLMNFGVGASTGGVSFAFLGSANPNNEPAKPAGSEIPDCFEYFDELYSRWDQAIEESEQNFVEDIE